MRLPATTGGVLAVLLFPAVAPSDGPVGEPPGTRPFPEPVVFVLDNGLRVGIVPWPALPLAYVEVLYPASPLIEPAGQEGITHLHEHLMFTSSRGYPAGGIDRALELATCSRQGSTRPRHTAYRDLCIPAFLPEVLSIEADRMGFLAPRDEEFEREKSIVLEEIAWRSFYSPRRDLWAAVHEASFPGHPMGRPIGGSIESVSGLSQEDLATFSRDVHGPTDAVLVITADVEVEETRALVTDLFGAIPPNERPRPDEPPLPSPSGGRTIELDRHELQGYYTSLGFRLPRAPGKDRLLAFLTKQLLSHESMSAGLYVKPHEYFLDVTLLWRYRTTDWKGNPVPIDADANAQSSYGRTWDLIHERIDEELRSTRDFEAFRARGLRTLRAAFRKPPSMTAWTALALLYGENLDWITEFDSLAAALTIDEMREYLDTYLDADRAVFGIMHGPEAGRRRDLPSPGSLHAGGDADRSVISSGLDAEALREALDTYRRDGLGGIETRPLQNGMPVHYAPVPGARYAAVGGLRTFPARGEEKKGKRRGVTWAYEWLQDGVELPAGDEDELEPPEVWIDATPSEFRFTAKTARSRLGEATRGLFELVTADDLDVERWRRLHRSLEMSASNLHRRASVRADQSVLSALYEDRSPARGHGAPLPEEAGKISYKDVTKLHESLGELRGTEMFVIGPPSIVEESAVLEETFGREKYRELEESDPLTSDLASPRGEIISEFQKTDVAITIAFPPAPVDRGAPDAWAHWMLAQRVVRERLYDRLRHQEGLIYSLSVPYRWISGAIVASIRTGARPADATRVFELLRAEIRALHAEGLRENDLPRAQLALVKERARWSTDASSALSTVRWMIRLGDAPPDPYVRVLDARREDVEAVMRSWLDPERFAFTVVGPILEEEIERFHP